MRDSLPNASADVTITSLSSPTSIPPALSSDVDLVLRKSTSTPESALHHTGPGKRIDDARFIFNIALSDVAMSMLTDSRYLMVQTTGNVTSHSLPQMVDFLELGE